MNKILLHGILKDIEYSHSIKDIKYYKAKLLVSRDDGREDLLILKFKKFSLPYKEGQDIYIQGNVRTFSQRLNGKNKVDVYVFTYFDMPEEQSIVNQCSIDGKICKKSEMRQTKAGKEVIDFIIANNIISESGQTLNVYIPCVAWGREAKTINNMKLGDSINMKGSLQSREYRKRKNDDYEICIAYEVRVSDIEE